MYNILTHVYETAEKIITKNETDKAGHFYRRRKVRFMLIYIKSTAKMQKHAMLRQKYFASVNIYMKIEKRLNILV